MKNNNSANWQRLRNEYFKSDDWEWVRLQVIRRDRKCTKCSLRYSKELAFEVHHCEYGYFGHADINEVETCCLLCRACHRAVHGLPAEYSMRDVDNVVGEW
jgi:hypothetical protein